MSGGRNELGRGGYLRPGAALGQLRGATEDHSSLQFRISKAWPNLLN